MLQYLRVARIGNLRRVKRNFASGETECHGGHSLQILDRTVAYVTSPWETRTTL